MTDAVSKARDTLLRALEELEEAEEQMGVPPDRVDLVVVYAIGRDLGDGGWQDIGGWASTAGPEWVKAALLERAMKAFKDDVDAVGDEPEDEPPDTFGSP